MSYRLDYQNAKTFPYDDNDYSDIIKNEDKHNTSLLSDMNLDQENNKSSSELKPESFVKEVD